MDEATLSRVNPNLTLLLQALPDANLEAGLGMVY